MKNKRKTKKRLEEKACYNCKLQHSDKCPNKDKRAYHVFSYCCDSFRWASYIKSL